ncbi:MAG: hypothetical protein ACOC0O_04255 [Spirochaetota bacterium]
MVTSQTHPEKPVHRQTLGISILVVLVIGFGACATVDPGRADPSTTLDLPPQTPGRRGLIVVAHGANGAADEWPLQLERRIRTLDGAERWDIFLVNWPEFSDRYLTASGAGHEIGTRLGRQLAGDAYTYEVVHLVGSSLGAHLVEALAAAYREALPEGRTPALIHATFLDPFFYRSPLDPWYGIRAFGRHADFAENYFTRDEPVLLSNSPLEAAANFDITRAVPPRDDPHFTYIHDYPIFYYIASVGRFRPGFSLSPLGLGVFDPDGAYNLDYLRQILPAGTTIQVE